MPKTSKFHIAIAAHYRVTDGSGTHGSFAPFVRSACDREGQRERVDLALASLCRALPSGVLVDARTGDPVRSDEVCRNCLRAEGGKP
jgi:hypothetical protein